MYLPRPPCNLPPTVMHLRTRRQCTTKQPSKTMTSPAAEHSEQQLGQQRSVLRARTRLRHPAAAVAAAGAATAAWGGRRPAVVAASPTATAASSSLSMRGLSTTWQTAAAAIDCSQQVACGKIAQQPTALNLGVAQGSASPHLSDSNSEPPSDASIDSSHRVT